MLKIIIKINKILNKIKIVKYKINARFKTIIIVIDEIIKFKNFFYENMFKSNFKFHSL